MENIDRVALCVKGKASTIYAPIGLGYGEDLSGFQRPQIKLATFMVPWRLGQVPLNKVPSNPAGPFHPIA